MATLENSEGHVSSVSFPMSESTSRTALQPTPLIRPFRRISLPTFPSLLHRNSVASVSSFDSLPENHEGRPGIVVSTSNPAHLRLIRSSGLKGRPVSIESPRRRANRRNSSLKPVDNAKAMRRRQVVDEFIATEKTYVEGLELIYSHFLTPIIASLETSQPLLDRPSLTAVFSNFIDIWNLHRSFLSAVTHHLGNDSASNPPPLSPILLSHFPYLSLYNPFITSFPTMISTLTDMITPPSAARPNLRYNQTFASFISTQECDPKCGNLKLRDWLLTIVQRCPRYILLLKDLIKQTEEDDQEYSQLNSVHALVLKITSTLNTSLQTQAQILSLLSLQRATTGLPFQLVEPGRMLLKRGPLLQVERSSAPREREFLLFSDCIIWLANEETERAWNLGWSTSATSDINTSNNSSSQLQQPPARPKKDADLAAAKPKLGDVAEDVSKPSESSSMAPSPVKKSIHPPPAPVRRYASTGEEKWVFKGRVSLVDIEIIVVPAREEGEGRRFEVLSPEGSFVLYSSSEGERETWVSEIRQAKAQLLASLNVTNPNSTLTSSSSTNHVRRALQALPFPPSDERIATFRAAQRKTEYDKEERKDKDKGKKVEQRKKVEHWVPAIWIPDEKTDSCMRCGRSFNWRRRRHHCRLCGRCVCAACSGRTFFISESNKKEASSKPARACEVCYETVFPLVDPLMDLESPTSPTSSSFLAASSSANQLSNDTIASLSKLPSWVSMPSLPTQGSQPQALMVDLDLSLDPDTSTDALNMGNDAEFGPLAAEEREIENMRRGRVKLRSVSRPKSYYQILEDFQHIELSQQGGLDTGRVVGSRIEENSESVTPEEGDGEFDTSLPSPLPSLDWGSQPSSPSPRRRKEDTARRSKRFSLPAVALQTTNVTARTTSIASGGSTASGSGSSGNGGSGGAGTGGEIGSGTTSEMGGAVGRLRRFSLLSGARSSKVASSHLRGGGEEDLGRGVAAGKLNEILERADTDR